MAEKKINTVLYNVDQSSDTTDEQKATARGNLGLDVILQFKEEASVSELNTLTDIEAGWTYRLSDDGTLTEGSLDVSANDVVSWDGTSWFKLGSSSQENSIFIATQETTTEELVQALRDGKALFSKIETNFQGTLIGNIAPLTAFQVPNSGLSSALFEFQSIIRNNTGSDRIFYYKNTNDTWTQSNKNVAADTVDGYHISVGSISSSQDTISFI
jgi:hypothetical protein